VPNVDFAPIGSEVVEAFISGAAGEAVTRRRYAASTTTADFRRAQGAAASTAGIRVFIPPVSSRTDRRAEGTRVAGSITMYSRTDFRAADEGAGHRADEVVRADGSVYTVETVERWTSGGFYTSTLMRKGAA